MSNSEVVKCGEMRIRGFMDFQAGQHLKIVVNGEGVVGVVGMW